MKLLLDTHMILWSLADDPKLPKRLGTEINNAKNEVYVSAASFWELQIKHMLHPTQIPNPKDVADYCKLAGYKIIGMNLKEILALDQLKPIHKDPFDRMLISQAKTYGLKLATADEKMLSYDEDCFLK